MKKTLIALAALAAAGAASAQSSVTLFGIVDVAAQYGKGTGTHKWSAASGAYNTSRIGLRGVEDLGGGLSASFWLEAQMAADEGGTGTASNSNNQPSGTAGATAGGQAGTVPAGTQGLLFNRRSTVSLAGGFGEIRLGRDLVPQFWNTSVYDPFGIVGSGAGLQHVARNAVIANPTAARASNSVSYFLPSNLGGIYGQAMYYLGENLSSAANSKDGRGYGLRLGYAAGPLDVAAAYGRTEFATGAAAAAGTAGDVKTANIGASWNFGVAKLSAAYSRDKFETGDRKLTGWIVGGSAPVGAGEIRASFSQTKLDGAALPGYSNSAGTAGQARKLALGYVHNLSDRKSVV